MRTYSNSKIVLKKSHNSVEKIEDLLSWSTTVIDKLGFDVTESYVGIVNSYLPDIEFDLNLDEKNSLVYPKYPSHYGWIGKIAVSCLDDIVVLENENFDFIHARHHALLKMSSFCDIILLNCGGTNEYYCGGANIIYRNGYFFERLIGEDIIVRIHDDRYSLDLEESLDLFLDNFKFSEEKRIFEVYSVTDYVRDYLEPF